MTTRRPSKAEREWVAYRAELAAERRQLASYVLAGLLAWVILERAPGGHWLTPKALGMAVWVTVGWCFEIPRALRGDG